MQRRDFALFALTFAAAPAVTLSLAGCSGIPLTSLPRLMRLQENLLDADPAQFMLAIQADARLAPPPEAVPVMQIAIRLRVAGAFEPVDRALPMRYTAARTLPNGLRPAALGRQWLLYDFTPESQQALLKLQRDFKQRQAQRTEKSGGTLSIGIAQENVAAANPALAHTRWESWLQTSAREGFYELWSGTLGELLKRAANAAG